MAKVRPTPLTREEVQTYANQLAESIMENYDNGLIDITVSHQQAAIDVTKPGDDYYSYEPGSQRIEITMKNPNEKRPESWI